MPYQETTALHKLLKLKKRIRGVSGGTSASKTISIIQILIDQAQRDTKPTITSITSESIPHLKKGCVRDFLNIMQEHNYFNNTRWNKTDYTYTFETGSKIEFFSLDMAHKVRGPRRDRLFINEANNIPYETFDQLEVRTKEVIWLDWNPTNEFWFYTDLKDKRDDVDFLILTYKDNEGLSPEIVGSIEKRKENKNWWRVYGEGLLGEVEGKIYSGWKIIDDIPHEARLERRGLDFGYSCLKGDTLIDTIFGKKTIKDIKVNDMVLTRNGYKKVVWSGSKGMKDVYRLDFWYGKHIIVTGDHLVFTSTGWKRVDKLNDLEIICVTKSSLTEKHIEDIQMENIQTTSIVVSMVRNLFSIVRFGSQHMATYLKGLLSIIETATHSITQLKILFWLHQAIMPKYIIRMVLGLCLTKKCKLFTKNTALLKKTGWTEEKNQWRQLERGLKCVVNAAKTSLQQMYIKSFVVQHAGKGPILERVTKHIFARIVEKFLQLLPIIQGTHVLKCVPIKLQPQKERCEVYDLTVEDNHEFFANGILVHNCDPSTIVDVYYYNGGYILDEVAYQKGLSNRQIADILLNQEQKAIVMADSAEPKSIDEIKLYGVTILPSSKGQGSVSQGIQFVQNQRISVTKRSVNLIKEYRNYMWKTDKDGKILNEPDHTWSHAMDAVRYALVSLRPDLQTSVTNTYNPKKWQIGRA